MAVYRQIQTSFWTDPWVMDLTPEKKYFYLYLLTNDKVKQCGIYEVPIQKIEMETGYTQDTILNFFSELQKIKKIIYNQETSEVCVVNFSKYNFTKSPKVIACIIKEFKQVKDKELIGYLYGIDTLYKDYIKTLDTETQEKEKKEKKEQEEQQKKENLELLYSTQINKILYSFGFQEDLEKKEMLLTALDQLSNDPKNLDKFFKQAEAYFEYKKAASEKQHGFSSFLGIESPKGVLSGGWNSENWFFKLEELKNKNILPNQTNRNHGDDKL